MKKRTLGSCLTAAGLAASLACAPAKAEDIEIFMGNNANSISPPNVVIVLDNTSNWGARLTNGNKIWEDELQALSYVVTTLTGNNVKVGLVMQAPGAPGGLDGGYVRFHVRLMDSTNRTQLRNVIDTVRAKMYLPSPGEQANNASYAQTINEVYQYLRGGTPRVGWADNSRDCGPTNFNNRVDTPAPGYDLTRSGLGSDATYAYSGCGSENANSNRFSTLDANAGVTYASPLDPSDPCQKTYMIYISNGPIGSSDGNVAGQASNPGYALLRDAGGDTTVISRTPSGETQGNYSDEWTRFLYDTDLSASIAGKQNVVTYTLEVIGQTGQSAAHTALMQSMATAGGGSYCSSASYADIVRCLNIFFNEIIATNSVFASVSLPVSVNVRGTNLDQVYIGVFRPDRNGLPRWPGNLKQYQLKPDGSGNLFLADSTGANAVNASTGQFRNESISFWTSSSSYWSFDPRGNPPSPSDSPDGPLVEKGAAAQVLRTRLDANANRVGSRNVVTCLGCGANTALAGSGATAFTAGNSAITAARLTPASVPTISDTERSALIDWARGQDNTPSPGGENINNDLTDARPSIYGDILHSRPAVVTYGSDTNIVVFVGGNDGFLRGLRGGRASNGGQELFAFMPEEFLPRLKRLRDNNVPISGFNGVRTLTGVSGAISATAPQLVTGISSSTLSRIAIGMSVSASDGSIPAGTVVQGVNAAVGVLLSLSATSTGSKTLTFTPNPKPYFVDGPISVYQNDPINPTQVDIFAGMRRGGRFLYALDVSDPAAPRFKWKKGCRTVQNPTGCDTGYGELGQTWSEPKVARVRIGSEDRTVLIMGAGYDPEVEDSEPFDSSVSRSMGRGIMIIDAASGTMLWQAGANPSGATLGNVSVSDMRYAIPADIAVVDRDQNGRADRLYFGDTGGQIWRVDIGNSDASQWRVTKVATLGIAESGASEADRRKFLYQVDVVAIDNTRVAVMAGSGDREHPLSTSVVNRFYMLVDPDALPESNTPITHSSLANNTTSNNFTSSSRGWYITLGTGEKCTGSVITLGGIAYFGTNIPTPANDPNVCAMSLGEARFYSVDYLTGAGRAGSSNYSGSVYNTSNRYSAIPNGGLPPSPVGAFVRGTPCTGADCKGGQTVCFGANCVAGPSVKLYDRLRTYWYKRLDKK